MEILPNVRKKKRSVNDHKHNEAKNVAELSVCKGNIILMAHVCTKDNIENREAAQLMVISTIGLGNK